MGLRGGEDMAQKGKVWLVGAGPGDIGLLTLKGKEILENAQVVVYDALVSTEVLCLIPDGAETINVGKRADNHTMPQEGINEVLLQKAQEGKRVVRLKGGDPFVFGRGGEELELLVQNDIPFEIVPGITSSVAVPAYAGIPVTHRDYTSSFHIITGHAKKGVPLKIDFDALVKLDATLVFLMGISAMERICNGLMAAGMAKDTPAAVLEKGTTSKQRRVVATVATLVEASQKAAISTPAIIVVGKVCALAESFAWAETRPLANKQIILTRPKAVSSEMAKRLRNLGAQVLEMPAIETVSLGVTDQLKVQLERISGMTGERWLVLTSPQGVRHFFESLKALKWDMRRLFVNPNLKFAAIGTATRKALEESGIFADLMPKTYSALELGKLLGATADKTSEVFIFRAEQGSKDLIEELEKANIKYHDIPIYRTVYHICSEVKEKVNQAINAGEVDYVTFTSASTVSGFVETMKETDFTKIKAICIGEQTAHRAREYGMDVAISKEASMESMIELIKEL